MLNNNDNKINQTSYLYENSPISLLSVFFVISIIFYLLNGIINPMVLQIWTVLNVSIIFLRVIAFIFYKKRPITADNSIKYYVVFLILSISTALLLGSSAYLLFPDTLIHQMIILFMLIALSAGASVSLASDTKLLFTYIVALLFPTLSIYLFSGDSELSILALALMLYMVLLATLSKRTSANILLTHTNKDLVVELEKQIKSNKSTEIFLQEYKNVVDESSIVSIADPNGIITYVNDKFCELSGYTREELIGKNHNMVKHPSMASSTFKDLWHTIKDLKQTWSGKIKNRKKDGSYYCVYATIKPIFDSDGNIVEFIALRADITDTENYKEILKNTLDDKDKSLEENLNYISQYEEANGEFTAILKTDPNNIITFVNEEFCDISGYTSQELIGTNCQNLRHQDHIDGSDCITLQNVLSRGEHTSILFTNIAKDGSLYYTDTLVYPITNKDNLNIEYLHLMHDVTELTNLHIEIEDTQKEIVYKMGEIGESRSAETGNHVKRVANYSKTLAKLYGLSKEECYILMTASPMHDIGKVAIPDNILKKPGKLTDTEFKVIKTHAEIGYGLLKGSNREVLKAAAIVSYEHHEKYDGSGYPQGLEGEDIHIYGRITAIADVFDALGSERCYKKAWDDDKIFQLLEEERGKHFDPKLIDLFLENKNKFLKIRDTYTD